MTARTVTLPVADVIRLVLDLMTVNTDMARALASTLSPIHHSEVTDAVHGMPGQSDVISGQRLSAKVYLLFMSWGITTPAPTYALSVEAVDALVAAASSSEALYRLLEANGFQPVCPENRRWVFYRLIGDPAGNASEVIDIEDHPFYVA